MGKIDPDKKRNHSIGLPWIYSKGEGTIFEYRNNRFEKEFVNELQIICKYKEYFLTGYLPIIFTKGDRVFVVEYTEQTCSYPSQYGVLEEIYDKHFPCDQLLKTFIGHNFLVKLSGIDESIIPTFEQYFVK